MQVQNENDNVPLTENPVYYPSVLEGSLAGVKILQLIAEDHDEDPLQRITYRITSGNPEGFFAINTTSGEFLITNLFILCLFWDFQFLPSYLALLKLNEMRETIVNEISTVFNC